MSVSILAALRARFKAEPLRRLRFTREGRAFVGLTLGVGFAAINTGNNLLYLVLGMMLSLIIVSGILSELTLRHLRVERALPATVYAGRPFLTNISVVNSKRRVSSFSVQIEDVFVGHAQTKRCFFLKVPARAEQQTSYRSECKRRGVHAYRGFQISTRFPFGFFVKIRTVEAASEVLVLPRIHPVPNLPADARARLGETTRPRKGSGREFHGLRPYRDGDDLRDVHWKRSARDGRLILREFETEAGRHVGLALDLRVTCPIDEALDADLEASVDLTASLVVHFSEAGYDVELQLGEERRSIGADGRGLIPALRALALLKFSIVPDAPPLSAPGPTGVSWFLVGRRQAETAPAKNGFEHVFMAAEKVG